VHTYAKLGSGLINCSDAPCRRYICLKGTLLAMDAPATKPKGRRRQTRKDATTATEQVTTAAAPPAVAAMEVEFVEAAEGKDHEAQPKPSLSQRIARSLKLGMGAAKEGVRLGGDRQASWADVCSLLLPFCQRVLHSVQLMKPWNTNALPVILVNFCWCSGPG
jgi:hypothetical protein